MNYLHTRIGLTISTAILLVAVSACDSQPIVDSSTGAVSEREMSELASQAVEQFSVTPIVGKSGKQEFLLNVAFRNTDRRFRLPKGLNILARRKGSPNVVIYDDGNEFDELAGDGIYSGIISDGCVPAEAEQQVRAGKTLDFTCTFEFVGPGKECGEFGECPERVHRSLLWGLIEYETDILFCVCIVECEVTKE